MATIKFGAIVTDARGKLGGHVLQKSFQSSIVKSYYRGGRVRSQWTDEQQRKVNNIRARWATYNASLRNAWAVAAQGITKPNRFGDNVQLTGRQLYQQTQMRLYDSGLTVYDSPVGMVTRVPSPSLSSVTFNITTGQCISTGATAPTGTRYVYRLQRVAPGATRPRRGCFLFMRNTGSTSFTAALVYNEYVARWGVPTTSTVIFADVYLVNSWGFKSFSRVVQVAVVT